jgi:hypothetical protein
MVEVERHMVEIALCRLSARVSPDVSQRLKSGRERPLVLRALTFVA